MSKVRKPTKRIGQDGLDRAWLRECETLALGIVYGAFLSWLIMTM